MRTDEELFKVAHAALMAVLDDRENVYVRQSEVARQSHEAERRALYELGRKDAAKRLREVADVAANWPGQKADAFKLLCQLADELDPEFNKTPGGGS